MPDDWVKINLLDTAVRVCKMKGGQVAEHSVDTQSILISFISIVNCIRCAYESRTPFYFKKKSECCFGGELLFQKNAVAPSGLELRL